MNSQPQQPVTTNAPVVKPAYLIFFEKILAKIPQPVKNVFVRFYSNKKVFWPIAGALGLVIFIVIIGLLFGTKQQRAPTAKSTPTPQVQTSPEASPSGDPLTIIQNKLDSIRSQINSLDVYQERLQPPSLNFNIKF